MAMLLLIGSLIGLFYIYAGYPLLIAAVAALRERPVRKGETECRVTVIMAAHNEAPRVGGKLRTLITGPGTDRIDQILVGSDGSTDDTVAVCRSTGDSRVEVEAFADRRGKPAVLNDLAARATGEILLFTDARQPLRPGALHALLENFADPEVGVVSGELVFVGDSRDTSGGQGMGVYWHYEKWIRRNEARVYAIPGASGAIYAMRRALWKPIPPDTLLDDVVIPMQAVTSPARCVFERGAMVEDWASSTPRDEAIRKRRTLAGCFQVGVRHPAWLLPSRNPIWWQYISHKLLRPASPWLLIAVAGSSWALAEHPWVRALLWVQAGCYAAALAARLLLPLGVHLRIASVCLMFVSLNLAAAVALFDFLLGRFHAAWDRSPNPSSA